MISVGQPHLPDRRKLEGYLDRIYASGWLTNNGPLVRELEERLADYLDVDNLLLVANGTLALQVAFRALGLTGDVVTTPFTFVATSAAIRNEGLGIRYVDINPDTLNLDPEQAAAAIGPESSALVPVHVYGNPCEVDAFEDLAQAHNLKTVYDAAHAFGVDYRGESLLNWGDASILSFHATKLFHTGEGGAVVFRNRQILERAQQLINFGIDPETGWPEAVGMNAKMSEFQAAVGLTLLDGLPRVIEARRGVVERYRSNLKDVVTLPRKVTEASENGSYFPVLLNDADERKKVYEALKEREIYAKTYFYPSLNVLNPYDMKCDVGVSEDRARQVLALPVHSEMNSSDVDLVCHIVICNIDQNGGYC